MWGNDPQITPADVASGTPLAETIISKNIPAISKNWLGWAGRLNGPVDNSASSCLSCLNGTLNPTATPSSVKLAPLMFLDGTESQPIEMNRRIDLGYPVER